MEENAAGVGQVRSCSLPTKEYADAPAAHVLDMEPGAGGENILIPWKGNSFLGISTKSSSKIEIVLFWFTFYIEDDKKTCGLENF